MAEVAVSVHDSGERSIHRALRSIAPRSVRVGVRRISSADQRQLVGDERMHISRAVDRRRSEFATGRVLLRRLIGTSDSIGVSPSRAPVLPLGVVASLSHDDAYAVAVVSRSRTIRALGVDITSADVLEPDVVRAVLRTDEGELDPGLAFAAKEATYKAWSSVGGELLEHEDVRIKAAAGSFTADVRNGATTMTGRYTAVGGRWLALVVAGDHPRRQVASLPVTLLTSDRR